MGEFSIHPETRLGPVQLAVPDLGKALRFYVDVLGFRILDRVESRASLGTGRSALVLLTQEPGLRPKPPRSTGLYHMGILLPSRRDLARALRHLVEAGYPPQGAADHLVSEALYLSDSDGNGIEIYADRPRDRWPRHDGQVQMATNPLDTEELTREIEGDDRLWDGLPARTRIGHIHLQVADLRRAEAFYHQLLGFDVIQRYGPGALFLSAGGYHHHLGLNTWGGTGAAQPPVDAAGLRYFTICLPDTSELERVGERLRSAGIALEQRPEGLFLRDPSGNGVLLAAGCGIM